MNTIEAKKPSKLARWGWAILLGLSALLTLVGINWFITLPDMALDNIAEPTILEPGDFMLGEPSSFDVITLIARGYGTGYAALGLLAFLVALEGYRNGTPWAWIAMWILPATFTIVAITFTLAARGIHVLSVGLFVFALASLMGLLLARKGLAKR